MANRTSRLVKLLIEEGKRIGGGDGYAYTSGYLESMLLMIEKGAILDVKSLIENQIGIFESKQRAA